MHSGPTGWGSFASEEDNARIEILPFGGLHLLDHEIPLTDLENQNGDRFEVVITHVDNSKNVERLTFIFVDALATLDIRIPHLWPAYLNLHVKHGICSNIQS